MTFNISIPDFIIVVAYLIFIVGFGCWAGLRSRKGNESRVFFLAGSTLTWPVIGLALFSTNISTVHLVSLAEEGYKNGLAYGNFEWMAPFTLIILALFFVPFYIRSKISTLPEFLEKRYSKNSRNWLAILSIVSAIFIHIGFSLYAGAVVLRGMFGFDILFSIIVTAVLTGLYTTVGGLLAVVWTESIQTVILIFGAVCLTAIGLVQVGGWEGLVASVDPVKLTVLRPHGDPSGLPWYSVLLGYPIIGIWYWCTDQTIVQRVLGAKDENHARVGVLFAGFIKVLPVFIFVLPGVICFALIQQGQLPDEIVDPADTYGFMIVHLLPVGLKGIVAAALLAALMSTISGALNSAATLFVYDLYKQWKPKSSERRLVMMGRIVTVIAMLVAILWSPFVARFPSVFQGINTVIGYLAPPVTVVFLGGVLSKKASSVAAFVTLVSGTALGFTVFLVDWFKESTGWGVPFMMASFYLACLSGVIFVVTSYLKPEHLSAEKAALVWSDPFDAFRSQAWKGIGNYKALSVILFFTMIILYILFK